MMRSSAKVWKTAKVDDASAKRLAADAQIPVPVARILVARGVACREAAGRFMNPRLSDISDPFDLPDMGRAVTAVWAAIGTGKRITVFGDYDVDGLTSTATAYSVLRKLGAQVSHFIPNRHSDGYGLSAGALKRCIELQKPDLVLTVDCGTNSQEAVTLARSKAVDVVVTDHHELTGAPCDAVAVVNPKRLPADRAVDLAGVGVAFKFCHALLKQGMASGLVGKADLDLREYLDLVALGTVADVVDLTGENRILVKHGLERLNKAPRTGLAALLEVSGVSGRMDTYHIGFVLGPRLNAAGRMDDAAPAIELLLTEDEGRALELAEILNGANQKRKAVEDGILAVADAMVAERMSRGAVSGIVVAGDAWHAGTIGIVAARLCARHSRPAVAISLDAEGRGRGSCRGVESLDLMSVLDACRDLLVSFGGHRMAAGLVIEKSRVEDFKTRFDSLCGERLAPEDMQSKVHIDSWVDMNDVSLDMVSAIGRLGPFGAGNPKPMWAASDLQIVGTPKIVGNDHLKLLVARGGSQLDAIAFGMGKREIPAGKLDIAFQMEENEFRGRTSLQLNVKDFRPSGQQL